MSITSNVLRCIHQKQTAEALELIATHLFSSDQRKMIWLEAFGSDDVLLVYRLNKIWKDGLNALDELPVMQRAFLGRTPRIILERAEDLNWDPSVDINQAIEELRPLEGLRLAQVAKEIGKPMVLSQDNLHRLCTTTAHVWFEKSVPLFDELPYSILHHLLDKSGWEELFACAQKEIDACDRWSQDKVQAFAPLLEKQALLVSTADHVKKTKTKKTRTRKI